MERVLGDKILLGRWCHDVIFSALFQIWESFPTMNSNSLWFQPLVAEDVDFPEPLLFQVRKTTNHFVSGGGKIQAVGRKRSGSTNRKELGGVGVMECDETIDV